MGGLSGRCGDRPPCVGLDFPEGPAEPGLMEACIVFGAGGADFEDGLPVVLAEFALEGRVNWPTYA
jgi:hypothetical protein